MKFSSFLRPILAGILYIPNAITQSSIEDIHDPVKRAGIALASLEQWYDGESGLWETTGWWNGANIITTIGNFAKANPDNEKLQTIAYTIFATAFHHAPTKNPNPDAEKPKNQTSARQTAGTGYHKYIDPTTQVLHTVYPPNYFISSSHITNLTAFASQLNSSDSFVQDPYAFLNGYYDDDLWWALAWITAYDVTQHEPYLTLAQGIFRAVSKSWPTKCGNGGIYWNMTSGYVNAIANELFFSTAAHLANRARSKRRYTSWAITSLEWFEQSGMWNDNSTINDGLDENCQNNNGVVWSYNQGVILGGLVELSRAAISPQELGSPYVDSLYLETAVAIARAALEKLSDDNGIIHDVCEKDGCGADGSQFKGIFMRNLAELHKAAPDEGFDMVIRKNAESIWRNNREDGVFSVNWAGPFVRPANASTHSSAMDCLVAAVAVS